MRIAVLTSGGVAPGINAAVRSVAHVAFHRGWEVLGVADGYNGLLDGRLSFLSRTDLDGTMQQGGSVLGTARSAEFADGEGQRKAYEQLQRAEVDGLVVIGGEGSLAGGMSLAALGMPVIGVPATIDNDISGTDMAVGVDTALNTAVEAMDRIKDTATSHGRAHVVKVLGRNCGYLALMAAISGDAEAALVPEFETSPEALLRLLKLAYDRGKQHFVVVVAEGAQLSAEDLAGYINEAEDTYKTNLTELGHIQSGGKPTAFDRVLASRLGAAAVEALADGESSMMTGLKGGEVSLTPISEALNEQRPLDPGMYRLAGILAGLPGEPDRA
ncbi:MAG: 6-phosphofructokinase [Rubrobacter sp.]|nr:6-phosphofructokinase [Rubrobacter sp.]